jgi:DNA segregation ATPase FtsK/SpoIIIE-like protein
VVVAISCLSAFLEIFEMGGVVGGFVKGLLYADLTQPVYNTIIISLFIASIHFASGLRLREEKEFYEKLMSPFQKLFRIARKEAAQSAKRTRVRKEKIERGVRVEPTIDNKQYAERISKNPEAAHRKAPKPAAKQGSLLLGEMDDDFELPPVDLLREAPHRYQTARMSESALAQNAKILEGALADFGVKGEISKISPGPVVTLYEFQPAAGIKASRVIGLADDIARSMSAFGHMTGDC